MSRLKRRLECDVWRRSVHRLVRLARHAERPGVGKQNENGQFGNQYRGRTTVNRSQKACCAWRVRTTAGMSPTRRKCRRADGFARSHTSREESLKSGQENGEKRAGMPKMESFRLCGTYGEQGSKRLFQKAEMEAQTDRVASGPRV